MIRLVPTWLAFARAGLRTWPWLVLVIAGCAPPPAPQTACRLDTECASGRCLSGICVDEDALDAVDVAADAAGSDVWASDSAETQIDVAAEVTDVSDAADAADLSDAGTEVAEDAATPCHSDDECAIWLGKIDVCMTAKCVNGTCVALPDANTATCATAAVCPEPGVCKDGICHAIGKPCDDGEPCTVDTCTLPSGCQHVAKPDGVGGCDGDSPCTVGVCTGGVCDPTEVSAGACRIGGVCYDGGASEPGKPCARCLPESAKTEWTLLDGGLCDDGNACTHNDACGAGGACLGIAVTCTDDNPCTDSSCDPKSGCVTLPNQATCDDGNSCSLTDGCKGGACLPLTWNTCDDANPCTSDVCDASVGCVHAPAAGPCQFDTDPCTTDLCVGGACTGVPLTSVCTIGGACVPAGTAADGQPCLVCEPEHATDAWTPLNATECDDGNACTSGDTCYSGACIGAVGLCDDKNPCTKNNCTPTTGCVFLPANVPCDDGNECTSGDDCATGKCVGLAMPASACDDNNPCTDDSCLPVAGCAHAPNLVSCNDGNPCTTGDYCTAGVCHAAHVVCNCTANSDCDDGNVCTVDGCGPQGECINAPIAAGLCDDGNACTADDHCAKGYCLGVTIACNDGETCSLDGCVPTTGCVFLALQGNACNDGNACTTGDLCVVGVCVGTPKNCDDGNACTADACKAGTGKCGHVQLAEGTTCTADGSACTIDACISGECNHSAIVPGMCQIGGVCMNTNAVELGQSCMGCVPATNQVGWSVLVGWNCSDGNACTTGDQCLSNGSCAGTALVCDDGNPCTFDVCNPLASTSGGSSPCLFAPSATTCDDGEPCTVNDTCQAGQCTGTALVCDDGNACTLDFCVTHAGCASSAVTTSLPCTGDGIACTQDVCSGATCSHPIAPGSCLIDASCRLAGQTSTADVCQSCQPAVHVDAWSPATGGICDDGDPCTTADVCTSGTCAGSGTASCDDGDACTADSCTADVGCQHAPLSGTPCQDGNFCTDNDTCAGGTCQPGTPTVCAQPAASTCGISACVSSSGCHFVSKCNVLEGCFQSACTTLDSSGSPAPMTVPLDSTTAPQPLAPSLAWQLGQGTGEAGLPFLRLAVQTRGCAPQLGLYSAVTVAALPAGQQPLQWQVAPSVPPPGATGWCAINPQFLAPATANSPLRLAWTEGGNTATACDVIATGGALRLATLNGVGDPATAGPLANCPGAVGTPARPAIGLSASVGASGDLAGVLVRAVQDGAQTWQGSVTSQWGGNGMALLPGNVTNTAAQVISARPIVLTPGANPPLVLALSRHDGGLEPLFAVDVTAVTADVTAPVQLASKLAGVDNTSTAVVYRGLDAVWDPDTQQVAVLISGTVAFGGQPMAFLAVARTSLATPLNTPTILRLIGPPKGSTAPPILHAFRIAQVPNSPDLLLALGATDATTLELLRLHPFGDTQFTIVASKIVANDFVTHEVGDLIVGFGGLSELAVAPDASAVSFVYETVGAVRLVSLPMP